MVAGAGSNFSFRNRWANPTSLRDRAVAARALGKLRSDVRFGSLADITARARHVRFTPDSGHSADELACPFCAISRLSKLGDMQDAQLA
jgi:hypothetical protein